MILPPAKNIIEITKNPRGCYFLSYNVFLSIDGVIIIYLFRLKKINLVAIPLNGDSFIFLQSLCKEMFSFFNHQASEASPFLLCSVSQNKRYTQSKRSVNELMLAKGKSLEKDEFILSRTRIFFNWVIQKRSK